MKKALKIVLWFFVAVIAAGLLFFVISWMAEYRPKPREVVFSSGESTPLPDTLTVLTWNIGYAGLGDNMDFFYDGGSRVRDTRTRTEENLDHIIAVLKEADADIMLLQEVDRRSRRSYRIDQVERLREAFPDYTLLFAYNYKSWWVPIPLADPMGRVASGLVMLSRARPVEAVRYQYPSGFSFPVRMFNLKRGLLSAKFITSRGDTLLVNNTHNTAFDTGGMRTSEMAFLADFLHQARKQGKRSLTGGDWNQYPPGYTPLPHEIHNKFFSPQRFDLELFGDTFHVAYDSTARSLRYLDRPYRANSITSLTDFFLLSQGMEVFCLKTPPEAFQASDHNPVVMRISLGRE